MVNITTTEKGKPLVTTRKGQRYGGGWFPIFLYLGREYSGRPALATSNVAIVPKPFGHVVILKLALWLPTVMVVAAWMAVLGPRLRRRRRRKRGLCVKCGYDLTGNESGVCSEGGAAI